MCYGNIQCLLFSFWFTALCITYSRFIHITTNDPILFLFWLSNIKLLQWNSTLFAVVVQLLSDVWLFATPWTAAHQAFLSFTISLSLFKFTSIESVMPSNYLILCHPLRLLPSIFPIIRVFSKEFALHIRCVAEKTQILSHFGEEGTFKRNRISCVVLKIHSSHLPKLDRKYGYPLSVLSIYFVQFFFNIEEKMKWICF